MKNRDFKEIKDQFKDEINDIIDSFFDQLVQKSNDHEDTKIATLNEIESIWGELTQETRDLYSKIIGSAITRMDESEVIASKKENMNKRG